MIFLSLLVVAIVEYLGQSLKYFIIIILCTCIPKNEPSRILSQIQYTTEMTFQRVVFHRGYVNIVSDHVALAIFTKLSYYSGPGKILQPNKTLLRSLYQRLSKVFTQESMVIEKYILLSSFENIYKKWDVTKNTKCTKQCHYSLL